MQTRESFCQTFGLHPAVGFGLFAVDSVLFASEVATFDATWVLTMPIALILTMLTVILQRKFYDDSWLAALGKGMIVGVLTAIPLPIASITTLLGGILGAGRGLLGKKANTLLLVDN